MKGQMTFEFLMSFLVIIALIGTLSYALTQYYEGIKTNKNVVEKRMSLEEEAVSELTMQVSRSDYVQVEGYRYLGEGNVYRRQGVGTNDTYRNKIFNDKDDLDCTGMLNHPAECTLN